MYRTINMAITGADTRLPIFRSKLYENEIRSQMEDTRGMSGLHTIWLRHYLMNTDCMLLVLSLRLRQISESSDIRSKINHFLIFEGDVCLRIFDTISMLYRNIEIFVQKCDQKDN